MTDRGQGGSGCSRGTTAEKVEGAGLGLVLSHKLIERHGSKMWVKSQVGQGSTYTFTVPVRPGG